MSPSVIRTDSNVVIQVGSKPPAAMSSDTEEQSAAAGVKHWSIPEARLLGLLDSTWSQNPQVTRDIPSYGTESLKNESRRNKVTAKQCRNKLKDIKRQWREVLGHNNVTGNEPKTCHFLGSEWNLWDRGWDKTQVYLFEFRLFQHQHTCGTKFNSQQ